MKIVQGLTRVVVTSLFLTIAAVAQDAPHWGVQGDFGVGNVPSQIVEQFEDLVEKPNIEAQSLNAGLVRFHADGSPSWAVEFTKTQFSIDGSRTTGILVQHVSGSGNVRGVMATKYLNFFSRTHISAGLALGGGIGRLEARYQHSAQIPPGLVAYSAPKSYDYVVPTFQILAQVDVRPVRWVSISPFYGIRNGTLGFGGSIRLHLIR